MEKGKELISLLRYAKKNITYYTKNIPDQVIESNNNSDLYNIFNSIPIVDKQIIKNNLLDFINIKLKQNNLDQIINLDNYCKKERTYILPNERIVVEYTSGTSGSPFLSVKSMSERIVLGNYIWRLRNSFYPVKANQFFNFIHNFNNNRYPFPFKPISNKEHRIIKEIQFLKDSEYSWWHTNIHTLSLYDDIVEKNKYEFKNLKVIENNGAHVSDKERTEYEERYNCKIANNYGCRETWTIAYDCSYGQMHICDHIYLELIDDEGNIIEQPNKVGNVVVTSLKQRTMPFIRYKIGDLAYYVEGKCLCGKDSKRIVLIPGRHIIQGTNLYGNIYFRWVVLRLLLDYKLSKFDSISVIQTNYKTFVVNIKKNREERSVIEKRFTEAANDLLPTLGFKYFFTYKDDLHPKSIFAVNMPNLQ